MSEVEESIKAINASLKQVGDQLRAQAESSEKEIKAHSKMSEETKASVDKLLITQGELQARLQAAEQHMVKMEEGGGREAPKSMGQSFVESEGMAEFAARAAVGNKGSFTAPVKAAITNLDSSAGNLGEPTRVGLINPTQQRLFVRDLLSWGRTTSNSIEYVRETGFTNNANVVAENPVDPKPESDLTFELDTDPVATIAHWVRASRQVLSDIPMLQSYIDGRLRYGLKLKEEAQLLKGSGVGLNLNGLYTQASVFANPGVTVQAETAIDRLRIALLQVTLAEYEADGIVLSPIDWAMIELTKTADNQYLFTTPTGLAVPGLWGRPVVPTKSLAAGEYLVGSFQQGAQGWDREDVSVTVSTEDRDNFVKNMVTILCEERVGLSVYRPEAFVKGDFDGLPVQPEPAA
ncbi:phage major capsid protein, HK97 family [Halopseudomonas litoralis]|uniref:Phage major capsid protein, HK97 family n=1 Tax=Halopseudomonas litoralis TaxID=797277 RepID=A0A1H1NW59_9GAMM|nr:phage major capsid protein [Halopseudomonas litoralis]SDS03221.1 phage major capsid protein, HK97 family [Halopseudomonas litoralis]